MRQLALSAGAAGALGLLTLLCIIDGPGLRSVLEVHAAASGTFTHWLHQGGRTELAAGVQPGSGK